MVERRHSSAYLGPAHGRWAAAKWSDIVEAAADGLLDETHWVDLKQELPSGRTHSTDIAIDLASLAIDGGLIVIGVEDKNSRAGKVLGVELGKLADRVDQIARDRLRPSLVVRSHEVHDPARPGYGCLLVHVPPSILAPHQVDCVYYGRGDRANHRLSDDDVRRVMDERASSRTDALEEVRNMANDDPIAEADRKLGHLYLFAQPEVSREDSLVDLLAQNDAVRQIRNLIADIVREYNISNFEPHPTDLSSSIRRAEGLQLETSTARNSDYDEPKLIELVIREDGGLRLICGRGTEVHGRSVFQAQEDPTMIVIVNIILGFAHTFVSLAGRLGDQYSTYQGQWQIGLRIDRLLKAVPADMVMGGMGRRGNPYTRQDFERVVTASTEELVNAPHHVVERLVAPLLRGLGVSTLYLPYTAKP